MLLCGCGNAIPCVVPVIWHLGWKTSHITGSNHSCWQRGTLQVSSLLENLPLD